LQKAADAAEKSHKATVIADNLLFALLKKQDGFAVLLL
jgi:hypothetical protein